MAATISREDMERAIREGGSVLHQGRIITRVEDLPNAVDLVGDDAAQQEAVAASLDAQIAALQAQRARLNSSPPPPPSGENTPPPPSGENTPSEEPATKPKGKSA